jgi:flagellar basal-body rod protein FlgC
MGFWNTLQIGASGLTAQRMRLDVISNNIANAETTSTAEGGAFQRSDVVFSAAEEPSFLSTLLKISNDSDHKSDLLNSIDAKGVKVTDVVKDPTPGTRVYEPSHPDADEEGYVEYPNVNLVVEMTNMISATRSYEANLNMITAIKSMATKALEIGR